MNQALSPSIIRNRAKSLLNAMREESSSTEADLKAAVAAFQSDMQPVVTAIVSALHAGDMNALKGLRALLPHLLAEVNASPALADVLAHQVGKSLLTGLTAKPEDVL